MARLGSHGIRGRKPRAHRWLPGVRRLLMPGYLAQGDVDGQTAGTALPCLAVRPQGFSTPELGIFSQGSPTRHAPCV
jgi:hypothetical protein